jgi:branched-chain amino acid transport system ATP-binding protein
MAEPVLELDEVEVRHGSIPAVRNLSFRVGRGEIVGLIGPNGAGKSTTLNAIMGLVPVHRGQIRLRGAPLHGAPEQIARSGVAIVPEGRHIFPSLTVEENLRLGLSGRRGRQGLAQDLAWVRGLFPVVAEFGQVRDHGVTILLVEQRGALTVAFADRTLVLSNAELRLTLRAADAASPAELTAKLTAAYLS